MDTMSNSQYRKIRDMAQSLRQAMAGARDMLTLASDNTTMWTHADGGDATGAGRIAHLSGLRTDGSSVHMLIQEAACPRDDYAWLYVMATERDTDGYVITSTHTRVATDDDVTDGLTYARLIILNALRDAVR